MDDHEGEVGSKHLVFMLTSSKYEMKSLLETTVTNEVDW